MEFSAQSIKIGPVEKMAGVDLKSARSVLLYSIFNEILTKVDIIVALRNTIFIALIISMIFATILTHFTVLSKFWVGRGLKKKISVR